MLPQIAVNAAVSIVCVALTAILAHHFFSVRERENRVLDLFRRLAKQIRVLRHMAKRAVRGEGQSERQTADAIHDVATSQLLSVMVIDLGGTGQSGEPLRNMLEELIGTARDCAYGEEPDRKELERKLETHMDEIATEMKRIWAAVRASGLCGGADF